MTRIDPRQVSRPAVRILSDPRGHEVVPFEIDTGKEKDIDLAPASYSGLIGARTH